MVCLAAGLILDINNELRLTSIVAILYYSSRIWENKKVLEFTVLWGRSNPRPYVDLPSEIHRFIHSRNFAGRIYE
jgi:hypothetical protein